MSRENKLFYSAVFSVLLFVFAGWIAAIFFNFSPENASAITVSGGITTINFVIGILSINLTIKRSQTMFMAAFFGGMLFRLALLLTAVIISLTILELKQNSFIFSIFFFYILYLIAEVVLLNFKRH